MLDNITVDRGKVINVEDVASSWTSATALWLEESEQGHGERQG